MKQYLDSGLRNGGNLLKDWLIIVKWWGWLPLGAGALAGVALPPLGWPWLLWIALLPLWRLGPRGGAVWGAAAVFVSHRWLLVYAAWRGLLWWPFGVGCCNGWGQAVYRAPVLRPCCGG
ncbi:MAG: hypothetical protein EBU13_09990 [Synechococcaceae bacterium WB5_2A_257]|nr:hypothetical protein [Synechococcaceae bacterium WB5_2A_257]